MNTVTGSFFSTENTITAACSPELLKQSIKQCEYYEKLLSKTVPGSDVWNINHACGKPVKVSDHTIKILKLALEMYDVSGGRFNIAIGSATSLWNFNDRNKNIPTPEALAGALVNTDCSRIALSSQSVHVPAGMQIDLGGIAKGYIADRLAEHLRENAVESALINLGGNIITIGRKPDGAPWRIGLQAPLIDRGCRDKFWSVIECIDESVVTSGSYERGFHKDGRWYHHIIDPKTGMSADNDTLSVTVCTSSSFLADALSTPLFLLGECDGMGLAERYGAHAAYYLRDDRVIISAGMMERLCDQDALHITTNLGR